MAKKNRLRTAMISDANKASEAMTASAFAKKLASAGFTPASMAKEAKALQDLRTQIDMAKAQLSVASAALDAKAQQFAQTWSTYCNFVRALIPDVALRAQHGVKSPGVLKGPAFRRGPRKPKDGSKAPVGAAATAAAPPEGTSPVTH